MTYNASGARTKLGLGTMSVEAAADYLSKVANLAGIADPATATKVLAGPAGTPAATTYSGTLTTASLVGKTVTFVNGIVVSIA